MIIGNCVYCDEIFTMSVDPVGFRKHDCEKCGQTMWTRASRIEQWSMKEEDFLKEYDVDEKTKVIKERR